MNNNSIPAVAKTVELLNALAIKAQTQAQLSRDLGITMSTTYRILCTLRAAKWVRKNPDSTYQLDSGLLPLVSPFQVDFFRWEAARQAVIDLSSHCRLSCKLSIRRGDRQYTLFRAEPENEPVSLAGKPGSNFPLVEGSVGAALLCRESEATIRRLCRECPENIREKSDPDQVLALISGIREKGYALNLAVRKWPIAAMSVPLAGPDGAPGALTLLGAVADFSGDRAAVYGKLLIHTAKACEKTIAQIKGGQI